MLRGAHGIVSGRVRIAAALATTACVAALASAGAVVGSAESALAQEVLAAAGVKGGLVVHVGCGDGRLTAALRVNGRYLVQGLAADPRDVEAARRHVRSLGLYGPVSIEEWSGSRLPYADNLVNLIVVTGSGFQVPEEEILRVLAPRGVAYLKGADGQWAKTVKPWPAEIDEWTHDLHDPGGNPVAKDRVVGPPRRLQWTAGPRWARSHGWTPSVSAMVSAGGRLFAICDETLTGVDGTVPDKWSLIARDAFSGVLLWKRPVPNWGSEAFSGTPGTGRGVTAGRFTMPEDLGKRLVAVGEAVYVTLGASAPVTALDAATGEEQRVYAETARADEILCTGGRLVVTINPPDPPGGVAPTRDNVPPPAPGKHVAAVDAKTGRLLWNKGPFVAIRAMRAQDPFGRLELAAGDGQVFALTHDTIESLDLETGASVWRIGRPALPEGTVVRMYASFGVSEARLAVMMYHDGVVLLVQPEPDVVHTYHTLPGTLYAFDGKTGRQMWKHPYGGWGHCTPPDVFAIDGTVWTHVHTEALFRPGPGGGVIARNQDEVGYRIQGLDLRTGELRKELPTKDIFNVGHHHRCYRDRSTERFLMASRRGVELVDLASGENWQNHWVRSGCLLGNLPCNGLLYVAPHPCGCYIEAKLTGFNALAAAGEGRGARGEGRGEESSRLEKGPAYGPLDPRPSALDPSSDWPTYRHDGQRTGATGAAVPAELKAVWQAKIGGRLTQPVVAEGRLFVASADAHSVHALDARDAKPLWTYTAGGRVDSPPTLHQGLAIFGSADGRVTCLRAADGALAWRLDAAPQERRIIAFDQLESPWPVPGSVLVHEGKCWLAAGRSSYLDGGIRLYALDPATGQVAHQETVYSPDPKTDKISPETSAQTVPGLLNDIPATDGASVFLRQMKVSSSDGPAGLHLYTTAGYLDPSWFNRTFWKAGRAETSGLMVLGKDVAYGVEIYPSRSRETVFKPGAGGYRLTCYSLKQAAADPAGKQGKAGRPRAGGAKPIWDQRVPIRITAMVRAGDVLFVAGPPDAVDPQDPCGSWESRQGGTLAAFSAADGRKLAEHKLPSPPVWDGMAAAGGRLYLSTADGTVLCLGSSR